MLTLKENQEIYVVSIVSTIVWNYQAFLTRESADKCVEVLNKNLAEERLNLDYTTLERDAELRTKYRGTITRYARAFVSTPILLEP